MAPSNSLTKPPHRRRPNNATSYQSVDPLPNPFDVPDTDMTIFFLEQPHITYPKRDVVALLVQAITRIGAHIQVHGDVPLTRPAIERYKNLELLVDLTGWPSFVSRVMYSELRGALVSAFRSISFPLILSPGVNEMVWFENIVFLPVLS